MAGFQPGLQQTVVAGFHPGLRQTVVAGLHPGLCASVDETEIVHYVRGIAMRLHRSVFVPSIRCLCFFIWTVGLCTAAAGDQVAYWRFESCKVEGSALVSTLDDGGFSRDGATVGHLGKGALEPLVWLYWRTKDPKYLKQAKQIGELNREWGGVACMINGVLPSGSLTLENGYVRFGVRTRGSGAVALDSGNYAASVRAEFHALLR